MSNELEPRIDQWYAHRDKGETFCVIDMDAAADVIDIQDVNGNIEELDFETWRAMDLDLAEEPEDWSLPYDDVEEDEVDPSDTAVLPARRNPAEAIQDSKEL